MYVVILYDANEKRVNKYHKLLKRYLFHVQNSSFEGNITGSKLKDLIKKINKINMDNSDSILIYKFESKKLFKRISIGPYLGQDSNII